MTDILSLIPKKLPYDIVREISTFGKSVYWCKYANKFVSRVSEDLIIDMTEKVPVIHTHTTHNYTFQGQFLPNYQIIIQKKNEERKIVGIAILKVIYPTGYEWKLVTDVRTPLYDEKGYFTGKCEKRYRQDILKMNEISEKQITFEY